MITSVILLILGFGLPFGYFYFTKNPQFGGKLTKKEKIRLEKSSQWEKGSFQNQSKTTMDMSLASLPKFIQENNKAKKTRNPKENIPIKPFDVNMFKPDGNPKFVWYGHSTLLLQLNNKNLLIDPMFGADASPVGPIRTKRFSKDSLQVIKELPAIDAVLLTHDHYDHLDFGSIRDLKQKVKLFLVPLGVGRHLEHWGIDKNMITEFDWWQEIQLFDLDFIFTPSRHFAGRGVFDRAKSLWGGWVIKSSKHSIYWSGDSGYDEHFKIIGEKYGPFDWGFMECGQYNERWHLIHMYPEETVCAALDAKVVKAIPVHWGAFGLALHHWKDPITRFISEAEQKQQAFLTPEPGAVINLDMKTSNSWWESYE